MKTFFMHMNSVRSDRSALVLPRLTKCYPIFAAAFFVMVFISTNTSMFPQHTWIPMGN